ncbi:MAG: bis(5'-nucleosyl)-tetraphosphatase (symmetrical) YqeK [Sphaerochaeta sp.]|nr:bis(5'-nucleosyl)-tetraphosphatase (symmetrical) YqeK [Sphaerochaeta sp.]MDX9914782.1 bis(5'-nucleosyl)-tetraphosphatase (symmetrical) YqeK [Sphaerochaeta sp.]
MKRISSIVLDYPLSPMRRRHSLAVATTAVALNTRYRLGIDGDELYEAGLHHDLAREWESEALVRFSVDEQVEVSDEELAHPVLLHAPVAAVVLERAGMSHAQVLAVRHHTLGSSEMGLMGKALFCADYLEPNRTHLNDEERRLLLQEATIEALCLRVLERAWQWRRSEGKTISRASRAFYRSLMAEERA